LRPKVQFLNKSLIVRIINESRKILSEIGITIHNKNILKILSNYGAQIDFEKNHVLIKTEIIEKALESVPKSFKLYNSNKEETHNFEGDSIHFTPGSSAINILDYNSNSFRKPTTSDYIDYVKVIEQLPNIASQSTAFIPADIPEQISDSYRLFLNLFYGKKPVVTGLFTIESFEVMYKMLQTICGNKKEIKKYPLSIFTCCPVSPLKWSEVASQNLYDCASKSIPIEVVSMPLAGFSSPVTIVGTLIQHTAEVLSGIVISQLINPGTPVLFGGSAAIFDIRHQTTPMGAIEPMMLACGYNEIGKYLNIPTQAYISLSDSKQLDAQAGLETGMGAVMAGLSGINEISGPGILDFINGFSLEKLVLDNEICGQILHMTKGISPKEDFPSIPLMQELLNEGHLLISNHTHQYLQQEHIMPGKLLNRSTLSEWQNSGSKSLKERSHEQINEYLKTYQENNLSKEQKDELIKLMQSESSKFGLEKLPIG
jgi:trimethylamine:corrinoid methyltransferase-like protein